MPKCDTCGAEVPAYYLSGGLCDSCKWDTWIPRDYQKQEEYEYDTTWGHKNRTARSPLTCEHLRHLHIAWFLDKLGPSNSQRLLRAASKPR